MKNLLSYISDILHPHRCTFCGKFIDYNNHTFICNNCLKSLPYILGLTCLKCNFPRSEHSLPLCHTCRKYRYSFSGSFTPLIYKDSVRRSIINMKFHNKDFYCHSFAYLICNSIVNKNFPSFDFVTYIPLSEDRFSERNFNQAQLIAEKCADILHIPVLDTLIRINGTPRQSTLPLKERRKNAKNSFFPKDLKLHGTCLLIDDVYTTGSTLDYCSSLLLKMGCEKVYISCVALKEKE